MPKPREKKKKFTIPTGVGGSVPTDDLKIKNFGFKT
jgi:hypothetical protein